ncbi:hypothetical protein BGLA2_1140011 [Burkholderia gladioli]|nr:hypothetical protein BGLA2_1140011 [Burkholderia gladioli]
MAAARARRGGGARLASQAAPRLSRRNREGMPGERLARRGKKLQTRQFLRAKKHHRPTISRQM